MQVNFKKGNLRLTNEEHEVIVIPTDRSFQTSGEFSPRIARAVRKEKLTVGEPGQTHMLQSKNPEDAQILLVVEPEKKADNNSDLVNAYFECFLSAGFIDREDHPVNMSLPLLGTGNLGWTEEESLDAFWTAWINFIKEHGAESFGKKTRLSSVTLYYSEVDAQRYEKHLTRAFWDFPRQWGFRGDPYLWLYFLDYFNDSRFDNLTASEFIDELNRVAAEKIGQEFSIHTYAFIEEFAHGGMSSGGISGFWAEVGIPMLCEKICREKLGGEKGEGIFLDAWIKGRCYRLPLSIITKIQSMLE